MPQTIRYSTQFHFRLSIWSAPTFPAPTTPTLRLVEIDLDFILLQLRVQQFLRPGAIHVLLRNQGNSRVYRLFDLLSFGCRKASLNPLVPHAKRILNHQRSDRPILQEFNKLLVGVEGNKLDSIAGLILCDGLSGSLSDVKGVRENAS